MDNISLWGIFLFAIGFVIMALTLLCIALALFGYKLHISDKKIEILPAKESPTKRR